MSSSALQRLDQKILRAAANREPHGFGIRGRADHDERRSRRRIHVGQRRKLCELFGSKRSSRTSGMRVDAVQRIRVTVADQPKSALEAPARRLSARLERLQRGLGATDDENSDRSVMIACLVSRD